MFSTVKFCGAFVWAPQMTDNKWRLRVGVIVKNGTRIGISSDRTFETEGEVIESGLRRTVEGQNTVMHGLIRAVYRFRDATLLAEKNISLKRLTPEQGRVDRSIWNR